MRRHTIDLFCVLVVGWTVGTGAGCATGASHGTDPDRPDVVAAPGSHVARAQELRALLAHERYDEARKLMAPEPRRWWERREGAGRPWRIGPHDPGPWAAWDDHFDSQSTLVDWREDDHSATAVVRETNDYFRLLERGWVTNEITYFVDDKGRIDGLLIRATGERPPGRTDEFLAWARAHEPAELAILMPGGEIDPGSDHPERFRVLLERWRRDSGLPAIPTRPAHQADKEP